MKYWDWEYLLAFIRDTQRYPGNEGPSVWKIGDFIERNKIGGYLFVSTLAAKESVLLILMQITVNFSLPFCLHLKDL